MDNKNNNSIQQQEMISLYLDQALDSEAQEEFQTRLNSNPELLEAVERERQFRVMIKKKLDRPSLEPGFVNTLRNMLH